MSIRIFIALMVVPSVECFAQSINFIHLSPEDGLPIDGVSAIAEDRRGYIWFGTHAGIQRFDGFELQTIGKETAPEPIRNRGINVLRIDREDRIWCGTDAGIHTLEPTNGSPIRLATPEKAKRRSVGIVQAVAFGSDGRIWIGASRGLYEIGSVRSPLRELAREISVTALHWDSKSADLYVGTGRGEVLRLDKKGGLNPVYSSGANVRAILLDHRRGLWIAAEGRGLIRVEDGRETHRLRFGGGAGELPSSDVRCLLEDSRHRLWFGTKAGLSRFDPATGKLTHYRHDADDARSLPTNEIRCLFEDRRKILWIGHGRGASRFHMDQRIFDHIRHRSGDPRSISNDAVYGILEDSRGRLWVGTEGGLHVREEDGSFRRLALPSEEGRGASPALIYVIHEAPNGKFWLGTRGDGLILFDPVSGEIERRVHDPKDPATIPHNTISALESDQTGRLWIGTGGGIAVLDASGSVLNRFTHAVDDPFSIASDSISDILVTRKGALFIATEDAGVQRFDAAQGRFERLAGLSSGRINVLHEDSESRLWIGTGGFGVYAYDPNSRRPLLHLHRGGSELPGDDIYGILQDPRGFLWFSTNNGLARYEFKANRFRGFDADDGLQSMAFHPKSACVDKAGNLYFGGPGGFNRIDPDALPNPRTARQVVLTGFEVNGETVEPGKDSPFLKQPIAGLGEIRLPFDKGRRIAFRFATLDYQNQKNNRYRYRMLPNEADWLPGGKIRQASYGFLPPGEYTFQVQASLDGQHWNPNSASINLHILTPWFMTAWARVIFIAGGIALVGAVAWGLHQRQLFKLRQKADHLESVRHKAEAALASQLQRVMLIQRTSSELQNPASASGYDAIIDRLITHYDAHFCAVYEYESSPAPVLERLSERKRSPLLETSLGPISPAHPVIAGVLSQPAPVESRDIAEDETFAVAAPALLALGIRSVLAIRTSFQDNVNGVLLLAWAERHLRGEDDRSLIDTVAGQIGINLAHRRLTLADIRQKAELEAARNKAEVASNAKSDFLAKMSHELRTPLNSILGFTEMLGQDDTLSSNHHNTLDIINASGEHLLRTINDILDMSKIESGAMELTPEDFDLKELIVSVGGMMGKTAGLKGLVIGTEIGDIPPRVHADKVKLRQILVNLVGNAIKFTESGSITLKAMPGSGEPPPADPAGHPTRRIHFEVADTGAGIPDDQIGKLFKKFSQTESGLKSGQGTGLGLAISKSFIELMGGKISVRSRIGVGTTFAFDILCAEVPAKAAGEKKTSAGSTNHLTKLAPGHQEIRILIAEDQAPNRLLLRTLLERAGFRVFEAENGKEAVEACPRCRPHLVFMDNEMPVMDGMQATQEIIRQANGDRPVIVACTAYALDSFRDEAKDAGCADFLGKPYRQDQLYEVIRRHVPVEYAEQSARHDRPRTQIRRTAFAP